MLKHPAFAVLRNVRTAAFRRLCVETKMRSSCIGRWAVQPPSGGCVLKQSNCVPNEHQLPAAFRRLCVETGAPPEALAKACQPPSGGCVLKRARGEYNRGTPHQPPSGGCVLKQGKSA